MLLLASLDICQKSLIFPIGLLTVDKNLSYLLRISFLSSFLHSSVPSKCDQSTIVQFFSSASLVSSALKQLSGQSGEKSMQCARSWFIPSPSSVRPFFQRVISSFKHLEHCHNIRLQQFLKSTTNEFQFPTRLMRIVIEIPD